MTVFIVNVMSEAGSDIYLFSDEIEATVFAMATGSEVVSLKVYSSAMTAMMARAFTASADISRFLAAH